MVSTEWEQDVKDARHEVAEAQREWEQAKDAAKAKKSTYDLAVGRLMTVIDDDDPKLPFPGDGSELDSIADEGAKQELAILTLTGLQIPDKFEEMEIKGLTPKKVELLQEAIEGETIGDLEKFQREHQDWASRLSGFGEEWITRLQNAHMVVRELFPQPVEFELQEPSDDADENLEDDEEE